MKKQITYALADNYILAESYTDIAPFKPPENISTPYGTFSVDGSFTINKGFLFSASGPTIDTNSTHRGACIHDFFYELMHDGHLSKEFRDNADYFLYDCLKEDGTPCFRAWYWLRGVRAFGGVALSSHKESPKKAPS